MWGEKQERRGSDGKEAVETQRVRGVTCKSARGIRPAGPPNTEAGGGFSNARLSKVEGLLGNKSHSAESWPKERLTQTRPPTPNTHTAPPAAWDPQAPAERIYRGPDEEGGSECPGGKASALRHPGAPGPGCSLLGFCLKAPPVYTKAQRDRRGPQYTLRKDPQRAPHLPQ